MDKTKALQKLLKGTATKKEIALLKQALASGEISIGGNVNQSVIILGSGNTVEITSEALDSLGARPLLGNLARNLNGDEIVLGLQRLEAELSLRAPALTPQFQEQARRLRPTLKTSPNALSESARKEHLESLAHINSLCMEALDISFNAVAMGEKLPEYEAHCPFRGLESFRVEDREFFFGREELTQKLVGKIKAHSFLAVLGASGSGKSSLVMAGMIPALGLDHAIFCPGIDPLSALKSAQDKALLIVDQFEELFTLTRDESTRKEFIAKLLETKQKVIITMRSDFLGEVGMYRTLSEVVQDHLEIVPPMDLKELRRAMEAQAGVVGLRFETDLAQQILDDVEGEPGAMPLLQHALWELWNRRHGRWLKVIEYRDFGRVRQAVACTADELFRKCTQTEQDQMRDIFLRLTRLGDSEEGRDTRRRVAISDLVSSGRDIASITLLLDKLANARLIVKTVNEDKAEIEVAHEALIRYWERLRGWLNEDRDNLRLRESVSEDAKEWENAGRDEALLSHRRGRLDDALEIGEDSRYGLTITEQAYLNACVALRNREQRERERRLRYTVIASIAAAVIFFVLGSFGLVKSNEATAQASTAQANADVALTAQSNAEKQRIEAEKQTQISLAYQLSAQAQSIYDTRNSQEMVAVLLAIRSMKIFPSADAAQILQINSLAKPVAQMAHGNSVISLAFTPDGKYVISGAGNYSIEFGNFDDNTVRVWEAATGKEVARMTHESSLTSVALSVDGAYIVSASRCEESDENYICIKGGNARVWETLTGEEIARMTHNDDVTSVAFSPDGKYVASADACERYDEDNNCIKGGSVRVWEALTGKEIARMVHGDSVLSVAFSPNNIYIATGSRDNTARVWEAATGKELTQMMHKDLILKVAFSPDGK